MNMKKAVALHRRSAKPNRALNVMQDLAWFRYQLRRFLRFSEKAARGHGVTPQQHQLMLGIAGYVDCDRATISELAEFLQEHHNSVVELVSRAVRSGLVRKEQDTEDRRCVFVSLTPRGEVVLSKLAKLHRYEVESLRAGLLGGGPTRASELGRAKARRPRRADARRTT